MSVVGLSSLSPALATAWSPTVTPAPSAATRPVAAQPAPVTPQKPSASSSSTNNIASATVGSVASITFNSTAGAYTLAANSGIPLTIDAEETERLEMSLDIIQAVAGLDAVLVGGQIVPRAAAAIHLPRSLSLPLSLNRLAG